MTTQQDQCAHAGEASRYVLGGLHGRRLESFLRHVRHCEECAEEVNLLQQVALATPVLGTAHLPPDEESGRAPRAPTPRLRLAAANARAARLAAEAAAADGTRRAPLDPPPRPVLRRIEGGRGGSPDRRSHAPAPPAWFAGRRLLRTPMPRPAMVSLMALGILAVATVAMSGRAAAVRFARIQAGWAGGGAAVKLVGDRLELLVENMPRPARGAGYQVWVLRRGARRLTPTSAWVRLNRLGQAGVTVPGDVRAWTAVAVYVEPVSGPDTTRSGAVIVGDLRRLR